MLAIGAGALLVGLAALTLVAFPPFDLVPLRTRSTNLAFELGPSERAVVALPPTRGQIEVAGNADLELSVDDMSERELLRLEPGACDTGCRLVMRPVDQADAMAAFTVTIRYERRDSEYVDDIEVDILGG